MTPPTKMTSLTTKVSHSSVVEHSNRQSGEVIDSITVGFPSRLYKIYLIIFKYT